MLESNEFPYATGGMLTKTVVKPSRNRQADSYHNMVTLPAARAVIWGVLVGTGFGLIIALQSYLHPTSINIILHPGLLALWPIALAVIFGGLAAPLVYLRADGRYHELQMVDEQTTIESVAGEPVNDYVETTFLGCVVSEPSKGAIASYLRDVLNSRNHQLGKEKAIKQHGFTIAQYETLTAVLARCGYLRMEVRPAKDRTDGYDVSAMIVNHSPAIDPQRHGALLAKVVKA